MTERFTTYTIRFRFITDVTQVMRRLADGIRWLSERVQMMVKRGGPVM